MTLTVFPFGTDTSSADSLLGPAADATLAPRSAPASARYRNADAILICRCINPSPRAPSAGATSDQKMQSPSHTATAQPIAVKDLIRKPPKREMGQSVPSLKIEPFCPRRVAHSKFRALCEI